jgi:putative sigma-54 modulation protein
MHITLAGIHLEITDAIRTYTMGKMRTLEKYVPSNDSSAKMSIELGKTTNHHTHGNVFKATGHLHIRGKEVTLETTQDDLYKAVDTLKDMFTREMAQYKDKERSIVRRGAHRVKALFKGLLD